MEPTGRQIPPQVVEAVRVWIGHHEEQAPGLVEGLYLVGSVALGDWRPGRAVDVVAMTADPPTEEDVGPLRRAADATRREMGARTTVDGPIVAWSDLSSPPLAAMRPWTNEGEFRFDGECPEINPVTWYTLERHGIPAIGGPTNRLGIYVDGRERVQWVVENVDTYWRGVLAQLLQAIESSPDQQRFDADVVEWCVLGIARMAYTSTSGDVTSKTGAGEWLIGQLPEHDEVVRSALDIRRRNDPTEQVDRPTVEATVAAMSDLIEAITR